MRDQNNNHKADETRQNVYRRLRIAFSSFIMACILTNAAAQDEQSAISSEVSDVRLSEYELSIWNDPTFQRQFIESYKAETEIEPLVTLDERESMEEILQLIANNKMAEAERRLQEMQNDAASAVIDFTLANIYFQQDQLDLASQNYQIAVDKFPKFRRAWKNLGIIYVRQSKYDRALEALTRVIELGGNDSILYGMLGFSYASVGNSLSAESAYRMAILLDPETLDWKKGLARSFFKQERYGEAVAITNQLVEEDPNRSDFWLLQANAYIGLKQPMEAAEIYELVDSMGESTPESLNMLGDIYINEELYDLAADAYIRAMDQSERLDLDRAIRSAKILAARAAYEETKQLIAKMESIAPGKLSAEAQKDLLKLQARIAVAEGRGEDQAKLLKEIIELDPMDGEALILLGQHFRGEGEIEQAIFYYERAAKLDDYEAEAKVRHAQLLVQQGKYTEALPLLRSAQQLNYRENVQDYLDQIERIASR